MKRTALSLILIGFLVVSFLVIVQTNAAGYGIQMQTVDTLGNSGHDCSLALDSSGNPHISYLDGNRSGLKYAWWDGSWHIQVVEDGGITGSNGMYSSLKLDVNGNPHIAYLDIDSTYHGYLRYAYWDGQKWVTQTVDPVANQRPSLALDSKGNPHITYNGKSSLQYASWDGSNWVIQVVDPGTMYILDVGIQSCLQLDSNDNPHVTYRDVTNGILKYASWDGSSWNIQTIDSQGNAGTDNSLALDSNGTPHVSYRFDNGLKYAVKTGSGWDIQVVDTTGDTVAPVGVASSLSLDSKGNPHISYIDSYRNSILKYANFNGSSWKIYGLSASVHGGFSTSLALDCNDTVHLVHDDYTSEILQYMVFNPSTLGEPIPVPDPAPLVPPNPYITPVSPPGTAKTVDSSHNTGMYTSIAVDSMGNPHVSYFDSTYGLKYAYSNGSMWHVEAVDVSGWYGLYTSLALDSQGYPHISYLDNINSSLKYASWNGSAWNIQVVDKGGLGSFTSLVLDSKGNPHISYLDARNMDLKYAEWDGSSWHIQTVDSTGYLGEFTSLVLDSQENPHISYYDLTNGNLKYASWTGSAWNIQTVDSAGDVGWSTSLKLDSNNNAHISYLDNTNKVLKYAESAGSSWSIQTVDSVGNANQFQSWFNQTSLALDTNGYPHISYFDAINGNLKCSYWNGSVWFIQTADSSFNVGWCSSLALDSSGRAHISYYDGSKNDLRYISSVNATGFSPSTITVTPTPTPTASPTSTLKPAPTPAPKNTPSPAPTSPPNTLAPANLELTCKSTSSSNVFKAIIEGQLTASNHGIPNSDIQLSYSADVGETWHNLTSATTDSTGYFSTDTILPATGIYVVSASWTGNATFQATSKVVNFAVTPFENQNVLSITSNSTVSQLAFNSTNMEFTFSVNGTSGTVGYINFYVAKSLISNVNHLNVYLDGSKVPYKVETQGDCWLVSFTYHHSSHRVTIQLNGASSLVGNQGGYWIIAALVAPMVIAAIIVQLIFRPRKSKIAKDNRSANSRDL